MFVEHNREGVLALEHSIIGKKKKHNLHVSTQKPQTSKTEQLISDEVAKGLEG